MDHEVLDEHHHRAPAQISPAALADRVLAGGPVTLLDVREDASWSIEDPA